MGFFWWSRDALKEVMIIFELSWQISDSIWDIRGPTFVVCKLGLPAEILVLYSNVVN